MVPRELAMLIPIKEQWGKENGNAPVCVVDITTQSLLLSIFLFPFFLVLIFVKEKWLGVVAIPCMSGYDVFGESLSKTGHALDIGKVTRGCK